jgi:glycosidase
MTLCKDDKQRMALAVIASFTLPGTPMIYYGDEVGMAGENDPDCRRCMNWEPQTWDGEIHALYQQLIKLRKERPALQSGSLEALLIFNGVFAYRRKAGDDELVVVLNPRETRRQVEIPLAHVQMEGRRYKDIFSGKIVTCQAGKLILDELPQKSALILRPVS